MSDNASTHPLRTKNISTAADPLNVFSMNTLRIFWGELEETWFWNSRRGRSKVVQTCVHTTITHAKPRIEVKLLIFIEYAPL
jgi:hypothetical protein